LNSRTDGEALPSGLDALAFFPDPVDPAELVIFTITLGFEVLVGVAMLSSAILAARMSLRSLITDFLIALISSSVRGSGQHQ